MNKGGRIRHVDISLAYTLILQAPILYTFRRLVFQRGRGFQKGTPPTTYVSVVKTYVFNTTIIIKGAGFDLNISKDLSYLSRHLILGKCHSVKKWSNPFLSIVCNLFLCQILKCKGIYLFFIVIVKSPVLPSNAILLVEKYSSLCFYTISN